MTYLIELTPLADQHHNQDFIDEGVTVYEDFLPVAYGRVRKLSQDGEKFVTRGHLVASRVGLSEHERFEIARAVELEYDQGTKLDWWA